MLLLIPRTTCHGHDFFCDLKAVTGEHNELVIVSDAHKSITNGFNVVYETTEHELCAFHLYENLKKNHKSLSIEDSFYSCARAYTPLEFEYYMRQFDHLSPSIRHELEEVGRSSGLGHISGGEDTR